MVHTAEIVAVGTELLLGGIANTNARDLSRLLAGMGIGVYYHSVAGDNPQRLRSVLEIAKGRADILITTGGLGPTCDDLTKKVVAEAFGKELVFHPEQAKAIRCYFAKSGRTMTDNNLQQAYLPEGCTVLENDWGTAPGCAFESEGHYVVMLPGPPSECVPMFREKAAPWLARLSEGLIRSRTLRVFGMGESSVESLLRERMNELRNPTLAPYAKEGEMELRITARAETEEEALAMIAPVEREVRALLGDVVYGTDVDSLERVVLDGLKEKHLTIGLAESCTGGLMAKRLTDLSGASAALKGGVVSYTNEVKAEVLGVSQALLDERGAVCPQVAREMAQGARRVLNCDLAVSATGVAGPDSDERGNPVGLVYVALVAPDGCWVRELHLAGARVSRGRLRTLAANHGFDLVRRYLAGLSLEAEPEKGAFE